MFTDREQTLVHYDFPISSLQKPWFPWVGRVWWRWCRTHLPWLLLFPLLFEVALATAIQLGRHIIVDLPLRIACCIFYMLVMRVSSITIEVFMVKSRQKQKRLASRFVCPVVIICVLKFVNIDSKTCVSLSSQSKNLIRSGVVWYKVSPSNLCWLEIWASFGFSWFSRLTLPIMLPSTSPSL